MLQNLDFLATKSCRISLSEQIRNVETKNPQSNYQIIGFFIIFLQTVVMLTIIQNIQIIMAPRFETSQNVVCRWV